MVEKKRAFSPDLFTSRLELHQILVNGELVEKKCKENKIE